MSSNTKLVSIFVGLTLLIPVAVSAQQTDTRTTLQNQIDTARQEVDRTCLEYFGRSCDEFDPKPMPEADEGPDQGKTDPSPGNVGPDRGSTNPSPSAIKNQIQDITPQQGAEGTEIRVKIEDNELVTESDDWNVHFGDTTIERKNIRISVPAMYSPNAPVQGYLEFSAPEGLEPGTYDVWISGDGYATNRVEFTLLDDTNSTDPSPGNVGPDQESTTLTDTYRGSEFTASISDTDNGMYIYEISGTLPNPCYGFKVQHVESTSQLIGWVNPPSNDNRACTAVIQDVSESGVIEAPEDADFTFKVEDSKLDKPTEGSAGLESGTTEQPTEGNTQIQVALDQIRTQIQMLAEQVFGTTN